MNEQMEERRRIAVFATVVLEKTNEVVRFIYRSLSSDEHVTAAPRTAIVGDKGMNLPDGTTVYVLEDSDTPSGRYMTSVAFSGSAKPSREPLPPTDPMHIEIVDMVEQGADMKNVRAYVKSMKEEPEMENEPEETDEPVVEPTSIPPMPTSIPAMPTAADLSPTTLDEEDAEPTMIEAATTEKVEVVLAEQADEEEDWDDTIPVFSTPKVEEEAEGGEVTISAPDTDLSDTAWGGALLAGGRETQAVPWRFDPRMAPTFVIVNQDAVNRGEAAPEFARVNNDKGEPALYALLNPTLTSDKRPAGASLASPGVSNRYGLLSHPDWVDPILRAAAEHEGVQAKVTSWNEGAKCRVDLDVSQATQTRKEASDRLKENGHTGFLDLNSFSEAAQSLDGLYKFGFGIENSIDGKGAFKAAAMALRVYCSNLASMGGIQSITSARHTKNVIADINFDAFGDQLVNATVELQNWLVSTEMLSWLPIDAQLMSRLMTAAETHDLLTLPSVRWDEQKNATVKGGYLWRVIGDGFANRERPHVAVTAENSGTFYHALQSFTGAYTHKPEWQSKDGKQTMKGHVIGIDAVSRKLQRANDLFMTAGKSALTAATKAVRGNTSLQLSDKNEVKEYIAAHPEVIFVPHVKKDSRGKNRSQNVSLIEVPTMEETLNLVG